MKKNPFAVLGLSPDVLRGLSNEQVRVLIKHMSRGLQAIYHPDIGGEASKMVDINLAIQELENSTDFEKFKKAYIKLTTKGKYIQSLELQLKEKIDLLNDKSNVLWEYLQCFYQLADNKQSIFDCCDVFLRDTTFCFNHPKKKDSTDVLQGELYFLDSRVGIPTKRYLTTNKVSKKILMGEPKIFRNKLLLGSIAGGVIGDINRLKELLSGEMKPMLRLKGRRDKVKTVFPDRFPLELFKRLMVHMSPSIKMHSFVFAINLDDSSVSLEGQVIPKSRKFVSE